MQGPAFPADHAAAFATLAGMPWAETVQVAPGLARYVMLLEVSYALHELVFGILFVVIVAIPFRKGQRWACWAVLIADVGYSGTFGRYSSTILRQSLIGDIALPVLLLVLVQIPRFFYVRLGS